MQSSIAVPPHAPVQSSTNIELQPLSQPLNTESPPHTPVQSATNSGSLHPSVSYEVLKIRKLSIHPVKA